MSQLTWGGHVKSLGLSLGWLCFNGLRLQGGTWALYPPIEDHDRLIDYLQSAGPDDFDAEALRALIGEYEDAQKPPWASN